MKVEIQTTERDAEEMASLEDFAKAVKWKAAMADDAHRFGRFKVFTVALGEMTKHFARLLVEAHRAGLLRLCRADLTPAMNKEVVAASEIDYAGMATFHMIDLEA